ncbi:hypothetical protein [Pseudomonas fluorescens]|uniref:hypothetical protein n=1 Tax=Pseudomonas fluorescens TaxID=294 RepID=UPI0005C78D7A|nr:hypothetical protein [Pseudomonas fluorescens]
MTDQTQRLEIATVRAEIGSNITFRFNNDAIDASPIPTESGEIPNLKQVILTIENKASVSTSIYPTVSSGLAGTPEGGLFLVESDEDEEIYKVWRKVSGAAVDTGKRALSSQAAQSAVDSAQSSAEASAESAANAQSAAETAAAEFQDIFDADQIAREAEFQAFMSSTSYESVFLIYGDGVTVERQTQLVQRIGELYRIMNASDLPLALSGTWSADAIKLQAVGDFSLRQLLSGPDGAAHVFNGDESVGSAIDTLGAFSANVHGSSPTLVVPPLSYSGNKSSTVLGEPGSLLPAQTWKAPVHIDLTHLEDPVPPATGPVFVFGGTGFTSGQFWSQDSYELKGGTFEGGSGEIVSFEPYTGLTAKVEGIRVLNAGSPTSWAVNFKQQNWWPIVSGNTFADYTDKQGSFCKIIDDGGDPDLRYSANSRIIFKDNRCKWLGLNVGGVGFYGSAAGNKLRDNAMEGASVGVILGYPSTFTTVDGLYCEQAFGDQAVIQLGDNVAAPSNTMSLIKVSDVYCNMHSKGSNRIVKVGNSQVLVNSLVLDRLFVTNIPTPVAPIVLLNDLPGQKILVGQIDATDMPLIPLLPNNYVAVTSLHGCEVSVLNSDFAFVDNNSTSISANTSTAVARNWWAKSSSSASFTRSVNSAAGRRTLRQSRSSGIFSFAAASNLVVLQIPRANLYDGENMTFQVLLNSSVALTHNLALRIYNTDGSRSTVASRTLTSDASWSEHTVSFYVGPSSMDDSSLLVMELSHTAASAVELRVTGAGLNRGSFGLCGRRDLDSYARIVSRMAEFTGIAP